MKVRWLGRVAMTLSVFVWLAAPVWCQEPSAEQPTPAPQPPASVTQEPQTSQAAAQPALHIQDAVVCQDVVQRSPVGSGDVIAKESETMYCFTRVVGATADTTITHNWYYKGVLKSSVVLDVRSPNWRTWSSKTLKPEWVGEWMVEVLSNEGTPLESILFFVQ